MKKTTFILALLALTTLGAHVQAQTIFFEDFNNDPAVSALPEGWTAYGDTLTNHPLYSQYNQSWQVWYPEGSSRSGEAMSVTFTTGTYESCDRWLITPRIALPADSVMSLIFKHRCSVLAQFAVMVSTTGIDTADFTTQIAWVTVQAESHQESISLENFAGDSIYIAFVNKEPWMNGGCARFIALDDIEVTHLPENSIALYDVSLPEQVVVNRPFTAKLTLFNKGRNFVHNITYSYSIDGEAPVEGTATIRNQCWRMSEVNVTITLTEVGEKTIDFRIDNPNGSADYDTTDNRIVRTLNVTAEPPVGIPDETGNASVSVYPNPTCDRTTINSTEPLISARVTDMAGRSEVVKLDAAGGNGYSLDLTTRPQGAYFLTLTTASGQGHTVKLIKQSR